jgi:hypothetical protein
MRLVIPVSGAAGLVVWASCTALVTPPAAAFTVTQNDAFGELLTVLLGDTTGLSNFDGQLDGNPAAFGTFTADPFGLGTGVVLSTGRVTELPGVNFGDGANDKTDLGTPFGLTILEPGSIFDTAALTISFDADETVDQLFFQYVFGSEEFLEFAGREFNDFFTLALNGTNLALLEDSVGEDNFVRVNNLVASVDGPFSSNYVNNAAGPMTLTRLDGFTETLTFSGSVVPGPNTLKIEISDVSDRILDSAVFIQAGTLGTREPNTTNNGDDNPQSDDSTSIPEPNMILGLTLIGLWRLSRTQVFRQPLKG